MVKNGTFASPATARASSVLPVPGRADEQHAARDAPAEPLEFLRVAQELDDLLQVFLGLVDAGHIVEGDGRGLRRNQAQLGAPNAPDQTAGSALHRIARHPRPKSDHKKERQQRPKHGRE